MENHGSHDFIIDEILPKNREKKVEFISYEDSLLSEKTYDVFVYSARYQSNYYWGFIPSFGQVLEAVQKFKPKIIIQADDEYWFETELQQHNSLGNHCELFLRQHHHWNYGYTDNTIHIPLGYINQFDLSGKSIAPIKNRNVNWSFVGCEKSDRRECIEKFLTIPKCTVSLQPDGIPQLVDRKSYVEIYMNTIFAPHPRGWTTLNGMRLYETTICGCIPVIAAPREHCEIDLKYEENPPWIFSESWDEAVKTCKNLLDDMDELQKMQDQNLNWWNNRISKVQCKVEEIFP